MPLEYVPRGANYFCDDGLLTLFTLKEYDLKTKNTSTFVRNNSYLGNHEILA